MLPKGHENYEEKDKNKCPFLQLQEELKNQNMNSKEN